MNSPNQTGAFGSYPIKQTRFAKLTSADSPPQSRTSQFIPPKPIPGGGGGGGEG